MDPYPPPSSMTLSPQSPPQVGQPSTVFRPRRSDDWHEYRETIEQLYRNDQLKLRDVKRIMERDYKFYASYRSLPALLSPRDSQSVRPNTPRPAGREKQYKDRLAAWHVRKNIKAKEVHLMIRKQQKRAARGKETAFRVNGQNVDPKRIARFVRRYGSSWDHDRDRDAEQQSPEPKTPSDMTCYTPEPEENAGTPVSPPDIQSPSREPSNYPLNYGMYPLQHGRTDIDRADPNHIDTLPDLVIDDDHHSYPMHMHSNQPRRGYHPPEPAMQPMTHHPTAAHPATAHPVAHPVTHPGIAASQVSEQPPPLVPGSAPHPGGINAPPGMFTHSGSYASLDAFQNRLGELQHTLNESMAKWAREQDPNQEIPHHEGLGL
ncbi:uncharacterized protein N7482_008918 [Penicillium canariense]|uniref:Clr5 domain-containing protein n=1 Tax=Penicillium canariense TaxID=189055 RepID=A0A9W9HW47_9EURO|nr:uncharacterized protein N7482_008918 [Penicillium canariense]KAJ5157818.1 hypothetical protein N7482_008918 [Penicillium canariense]